MLYRLRQGPEAGECLTFSIKHLKNAEQPVVSRRVMTRGCTCASFSAPSLRSTIVSDRINSANPRVSQDGTSPRFTTNAREPSPRRAFTRRVRADSPVSTVIRPTTINTTTPSTRRSVTVMVSGARPVTSRSTSGAYRRSTDGEAEPRHQRSTDALKGLLTIATHHFHALLRRMNFPQQAGEFNWSLQRER